MRRRAAALAALCVLAAACSPPGRETVLPDIPDELPPATTTIATPEPVCQLGFGTGKGVEVLEVVAGVPAEAVLAPGDVVVAVDGRAVTDSTQLVSAIQSKSIGDTISVDVEREDREFTGDVELVEHTDTPGTPMAGISIRTAVDLVAPDELATVAAATIGGSTARVVQLAGRLFALDPLEGQWEPIADRPPEGAWAAAAGAVYTIEDADPDTLVEVASAGRLDLAPGNWNTRWVLGSVGSDVLLLAERTEGDTLEAGLLAVDPATGEIHWDWLPGMSGTGLPLVPVLSVADPTQSRVLVGLTELAGDGAESTALTLVVLEASGDIAEVTTPADGAIPEGSIAVGWHDAGMVALLPPEQDRVILWDVDTGAIDEVAVPRLSSATDLVPVGDGHHFIMETATGLDLVAPETVRPLAVDCTVDRISALGYGSG
ncbi:MAG: PDZ domain-containing protein [Actinobacteria bacterium]|nr:MAG: PDZ domain-containing protein [Actinomycetota bacterium]